MMKILFLLLSFSLYANYVNYPSGGSGTGLPLDGNLSGLVLRSTGNGIGEWITPKPRENYYLKSDINGNAVWDFATPFPYTPGDDYLTGYRIYGSGSNRTFVATRDFTASNTGTATNDILADLMENMDLSPPPDLTTGVLESGVLSWSGTGYDVTAGKGVLVRNNNTPFPSYRPVFWNATTNIPLADAQGWNTLLVTPGATRADPGTVAFVSGLPNPDTYKVGIVLGVVYAPENLTENLKGSILDHGNTIRTLSLFIGIMKRDLNFVGNANQTFLTQSGQLYFNGISPLTENPNVRNCAAQAITNFRLYDQDTYFGFNTVVPTSQYDNGGTLTNITGSNWSCMKVFLDPTCSVSLQYCQGQWNTLSEAVNQEALTRDAYVLNSALTQSAKFYGLLFFLKSAASLNDTNISQWNNCGILGCGTAGSGAAVGAGGDVLGPAVSQDNQIARFDGLSGKVIQTSGVTIDDSNNITGAVNISISGDLTTTSDGSGVIVGGGGGGRFYKKSGGGITIRESSGGQQPRIEDNDGSNGRDIVDASNFSTYFNTLNAVTKATDLASAWVNGTTVNGTTGVCRSRNMGALIIVEVNASNTASMANMRFCDIPSPWPSHYVMCSFANGATGARIDASISATGQMFERSGASTNSIQGFCTFM